MVKWAPDELSRVGDAEELQLASRRSEGTLRPYVTMWVVPHGCRRPRRSRVYRAIVLDENAVNTLMSVYAVAVDRRGVAAWPS
jgi:hypothetical protein